MRMSKRAWCISVLLFCAGCWLSVQAEQVLTYPDLVRRITDLEQLAVLPEPGEKCLQWSSYDRASKYEDGHYLAWDANGDHNGCLRKEGDLEVWGEMEGPGCIWRIWSAAPGEGHVKIYIDGFSVPAVDLPFTEYFNCTQTPFNYSELNHVVAKGWNCYVPIPFQKSCRIVAEPGWGSYYHVTYSLYDQETRVPSFSRDLDPDSLLALMNANETLKSRGVKPVYAENRKEGILDADLAPGDCLTVAKLKGPRAITALRVKIKLDADEEIVRNTLRELILRITWDDDKEPAVWVPIGDFFGTAPGANEYRSLPSGLIDQEWYSYWYMPFEKSAKVEVINEGTRSQVVFIRVEHSALTRPVEKLGRFHAKWHRDAFLPESPERKIDWPMLITEGQGRFCGVMLHVWNPKGSWWGEGDEKFFVDGEPFPSTFGTGSEDYFGYAWCDPTLFQHGLHNQTLCTKNKGHISVNRWHIADNIPFQTRFEGYIEKYFPNDRPTLYAATVYWYLAPGGKDPYQVVPAEERLGYWYPLVSNGVKGAVEGESLKVVSCTGGQCTVQDMSGFTEGEWSRDEHLWWRDAKEGQKLTVEFNVEKTQIYLVRLAMTKAPDYGIFQVYLDGHKAGEPIDLYDKVVTSTGPMELTVLSLKKGKHHLTFELVGNNPKSIPSHMLGLDYILLENE